MAHPSDTATSRRPRPRRRAAWRWLAATLLVAAALGFALAAYHSLRQELSRHTRRLEDLAGRVARLEQTVERLERQAAAARLPERARVYFTRSGPNGQIELVAVERPIPAAPDPEARLSLALEALLRGPTPEEQQGSRPLMTQLPQGTRLLGVRIEGDTGYLDFSRELERTAGTMRLSGLLRQIVFTATEVAPVRRVVLLVEGDRVGTEQHPFTGDGLLFGELTRERLPL